MIRSILLALLLNSYAFAEYKINTYWNSSNEKEVVIECTMESSSICLKSCLGFYDCNIPEEICYNCVGNDLFLVNFYKNIGLNIGSSHKELPLSKLTRVLHFGEFITLKANSIYNIISDYDSKSMKRKFRKLCPEDNKDEDPIVFVKVDRNRKPVELEFVLCHGKVYEMTMDQAFLSSNKSIQSELY